MELRTMADFGTVVREERLRRGLTQAELASRSGVSREWVNAVEGGKKAADARRLIYVLDELDLALTVTRRTDAAHGD